MKILVTGGAGYIGSHTAVELIEQGHDVVIVDNLSNSRVEVITSIGQIVGQEIPFYEADCGDAVKLNEIFEENHFDAVIHFAGLKGVGESVEKPLLYYQNNLGSTMVLCEVMQNHNIKNMIFSSSATVYGNVEELPLKETSPTGAGITNPYGQTKYMLEQILRDIATADPQWRVSMLRYFNPIGAHESGLIGEAPNGLPNNLLPYIAKVATSELPLLRIFGDDYDTRDGTGVRDYIHVVDLAKGHVAALDYLIHRANNIEAYNLGTGKGTTVMELLKAFEQASHKEIPYEVVMRRPGDIASCYADTSKAERELSWKAAKTIAEACADTWRWQTASKYAQRVSLATVAII